MTETDKMILLYQLETLGDLHPEKINDISEDEALFIRTSGEYVLWESGKRDFSHSEVSNSQWLETTYRGQAAKLDCLRSRDAVLCPLQACNKFLGEWHIHNGFLQMNLAFSNYDLELFSAANIFGDIHSLLLFKEDDLMGYAHITLMQGK